MQAGIAAERSLDVLTHANEQLRVDIEKWHEATNKEMSHLMRDVADNHIEYHQKVGVRVRVCVGGGGGTMQCLFHDRVWFLCV